MLDQIVVVLYMIAVLVLGILVGRDTKSITDFAIGKRNFSNFVLLSTLFASVIDGSGTLGLAETIFSSGPIFLLSYLGILFSYLTLAFFIAPKLDSFLGLLSSGDILGKLYGPKAKIFMGFATVFESILLTGIQFMAMTSILTYFFSLPANTAAYGSTIIILIYSLRGGIRAVTATDVFQFAILLIAIPIICGIAISKLGGLEGLKGAISLAHNQRSQSIEYGKHLAIFISFAIPALFPLTIQRMLMAKNTQQITTTFSLTALMSFPFYLTIGAIAVSAFVLLPTIEPNFIFPAMINEFLPAGIKGFVIAGLLAVFMSSIDSDLNVASVAITHDMVTPLFGFKISEKNKLIIARLSSLIIAFVATAIALEFDSIFSIMMFVLCVCNSAFFPGFFIGLLGFKPGTKGFWIGLVAAICSVIFFTYVVKLFELYTGIISILLNCAILIYFHLKNNIQVPLEIHATNKRKKFFRIFTEPALNLAVRRPGYYSIFSLFSIINMVIPFFIIPLEFAANKQIYFALFSLGGMLSYLIMFKEFWPVKIYSIFPLVWYANLLICLPCYTALMCFYSGFNTIWLLDSAVVISLLLILTNTRSLILMTLVGVIFSTSIYALSAPPINEHLNWLGNWSIGLHISLLVGCLFLFRKQDIETYQYLSGKLAHEAKRSLSSLTQSAFFLKANMPTLIETYNWAIHNGYRSNILSENIRKELDVLPDQLQQMGLRNSIILNNLFERIYPNQQNKFKFEEINILNCILDAINDPSFNIDSKKRIYINKDYGFSFQGNKEEITQVIINIVENAVHAIASTKNGLIEIWASERTLFVRDNGTGISKKDLPNIFDDFFSTKNTLGQGLSYAKLVMAEHMGHIRCRSVENEFTQIEMTFPLLRNVALPFLSPKKTIQQLS